MEETLLNEFEIDELNEAFYMFLDDAIQREIINKDELYRQLIYSHLTVSLESFNIETIKQSKSHLFLVMKKLKRYIASVSKGIEKNSKLLRELMKKPIKEEKLKDKNLMIAIPNFKILSDMYVSVNGLHSLLKDIKNGEYNIKEFNNINNLTKNKNESKLLNVIKECQGIVKKNLGSLPLSSIGLELITDNKNIYTKGFRILHKQPDWEKNLKKSSITTLGYEINKFLKVCNNSMILDEHIKDISILHENVLKLETLFYKFCKEAEDRYTETKDEYYLKICHSLLSVFYMAEILDHKIHMWTNKLWKYEIRLLKHLT